MGFQGMRRRASRILFLATALWTIPAGAADVVWDKGAGTSLWTDAANWVGDVAPGATDTAIFDTDFGTVSLGGYTRTIDELRLSPPPGTYRFYPGSLKLNRIVQTSGDVNLGFSISAPSSLELEITDARLTLSGSSIPHLLRKIGSGEVVVQDRVSSVHASVEEGTLTASSTSSLKQWTISLQQATLNLQANQSAEGANITADDGARINITAPGGGTTTKITLNPGSELNVCDQGLLGSAATVSLNGGTATLTGSAGGVFAVNASSAIRVNDQAQVSVSSLLLNSGALNVTSTGNAAGLKTTTSIIPVGASVSLANDIPVDLGTMTLKGTLALGGSAPVSIASLSGTNGLIQVDQPIEVSIGSASTAFGRVAVNAGTVTANVTAGIFDVAPGATLAGAFGSSATVHLNGGRLSLRSDTPSSLAPTVDLSADSRIDVGPSGSASDKTLIISALTMPEAMLTVDGSSGYGLTLNTLTTQGPGDSSILANAPLTINTLATLRNSLTIENDAPVTINAIAGAFAGTALTKRGSGTLAVGSNKTASFYGSLLLQEGNMVFAGSAPFSGGSVHLNSGTTLTLSAQAQGTNTITADVGSTIIIAGINALGPGLTQLNGATLQWQKSLITQGGQLAVSGSSTILLPGDDPSTASRIAGSLAMDSGTLSITGNDAMPITFTGVTVGASANPAVLANDSAITLGSSGASGYSLVNGTLVHSGSGALAMGQLRGPGTVRQDSAGLLTLLGGVSNPSPAFTGELDIDSGALRISGSYGAVGGTIRMAPDTQLTLGAASALSGTSVLTDTGVQVLVSAPANSTVLAGASITLAPGATLTTTAAANLGASQITLAGGSMISPATGALTNASLLVTADSVVRSDYPASSGSYPTHALTLGDARLSLTGSAGSNYFGFSTATVEGTGHAVLDNDLRLAINTLRLNQDLVIEGTGDVGITTLSGAGTLTSNATSSLTLNAVDRPMTVFVNKGTVVFGMPTVVPATVVLADQTSFATSRSGGAGGWLLSPSGGTIHCSGSLAGYSGTGGLSPIGDTTVVLDGAGPLPPVNPVELSFANITLDGRRLSFQPGTATVTSMSVTTLQTTGTEGSTFGSSLGPGTSSEYGAHITYLNLDAPLTVTGSGVIWSSRLQGDADLTIAMDPGGSFIVGAIGGVPGWTGDLIVRSGTASINDIHNDIQLYGGTAALLGFTADNILLAGGTLSAGGITTVNTVEVPAASTCNITCIRNSYGSFTFKALHVGQDASIAIQSMYRLQLNGPLSCDPGTSFNLTDSDVALKSDPGTPDAMNLAINTSGSSHITLSSTAHLNSLSLDGHSTFNVATGLPAPVLIHLKQLSIGTSSAVDVEDGTLIIDPDPADHQAVLDQFNSYLAIGSVFNWMGFGIHTFKASQDPTHTHTLGLLDNAVAGLATFGGEPLAPESIIVTYTLHGDADLDGALTLDDFDALLAGAAAQPPNEVSVAASLPYWFSGNFNYDAAIDVADLELFLGTYLSVNQLASLPPALAGEMLARISASGLDAAQKVEFSDAVAGHVPEPGALGALLVVPLLLGRRRR